MALTWSHCGVGALSGGPGAFQRISSSFLSSAHTTGVSVNFAPGRLVRNRGLFLTIAKKDGPLDVVRNEIVFPVRAQAEVRSADGQAEFETGVEVDENERKGLNGGQDKKKAKALSDSTIYPIMRVYRDDLCSLEVTGDARARQVIEAMAADGGLTASEELAKGRSLMTVETIIPGHSNDHGTVSTKLLAPTELVSQRAKNMWSPKVSSRRTVSSGNALARAFETVVMQHLLSFDIHVHSAGTVRDMTDLANEGEDGVFASLESRDPQVLEGLSEALCSYSLSNIEDNFDQKVSGKNGHNNIFSFWTKPDWIWALDKAIGVCPLSENEIREHVEKMVNEGPVTGDNIRTHQAWWPLPVSSSLSKLLPEQDLNSWGIEFIPIHKLQIDTSRVKVFTKGWQTSKSAHILELHLTHCQMVDLAGALDMYYADRYTTPSITLSRGIELKSSHLSRSKVTNILWATVISCVTGAVVLVSLLVVAKVKTLSSANSPLNAASRASSSSRPNSSFTDKWCRVQTRLPLLPKNNDMPAEEMEALCVQVVNRVKHAFNLAGEVQSCPLRGAWLGADLTQWEVRQDSAEAVVHSSDGDNMQELGDGGAPYQVTSGRNFDSPPLEKARDEENLLLYQVVLSKNGKVQGFQPGNMPAVARWAEYPFAQELHKNHRLGPGPVEGGLRYSELSEDVVAVELICQINSDIPSITARPLKL